jgi:ABC-type multidrug transport system ATPase subunit
MRILSGNYGDNLELSKGNVYINGYLTTGTQRQKGNYIGYVEQQETFIETMTIEEHLIFQVKQQILDFILNQIFI